MKAAAEVQLSVRQRLESSPEDDEGAFSVDTVTPKAMASTSKAPTASPRPIPVWPGQWGKQLKTSVFMYVCMYSRLQHLHTSGVHLGFRTSGVKTCIVVCNVLLMLTTLKVG